MNVHIVARKIPAILFVLLATDGEEAAPAVEDTNIDPNELLQVSTEHECQESSPSQPGNGLVNDITKQQMIVQFLKVGAFLVQTVLDF